MTFHQDIAPFEYIIGFATVAALVSVTELTEVLKLIILIITVIGAAIKLVEQYFRSEGSLKQLYLKITALWKKILKKNLG